MSKALIVTSDDNIRYLYEMAIKFQKIEVRAAKTIKEAVKKILAELPDLVVLDLESINIDEMGAFKEIKAKVKNVPMIVMTELSMAEAKKKACVMGVCEVLTKKEATLGNLIKKTRQKVKK